MYGDVVVLIEIFYYMIDYLWYDFKIFGLLKMSIFDVDYMIGLYVSILVKDGGEL